MVKREEVEEILIGCGDPPLNTKDDLCIVPATTLAELCRTWLAVDAAPVGRTVARDESWKRGGQTGVYVDLDGVVPVRLLQRVRLVPEADSGGDRG